MATVTAPLRGSGGSGSDGHTSELFSFLVNSQAMRSPCAVVPDRLIEAAGITGRRADDHRCHWIPQLDERRPACGESRRLENVASELWCLRPEGHVLPHW